MSTQNGTSGDAAAIIEAARRATHVGDRVMLVEGPDKQKYPVAIQSDGRVGVFQELLLVMDQRAPRPLRAAGKSIHVEAASFIDHVNRHKVANSVIFCDPVLFAFTAIYNYNEPSLQVLPPVKLERPVPSGEGGIEIAEGVQMPLDCNTRPGFGDFRAEYACPRSPEWVLWTKAANEMMSSEAFAELIEANTKDIIQLEGSPTPAALLGLARDVSSGVNPLTSQIRALSASILSASAIAPCASLGFVFANLRSEPAIVCSALDSVLRSSVVMLNVCCDFGSTGSANGSGGST